MSGFEQGKFKIHQETTQTTEIGKIAVESPSKTVVTPYQYVPLKASDSGSYKAVKSKFGSLAATDKSQETRSQRDQRFSLNSLLRGPLSIEEEERRVIDERVKEGIQSLAKEAEEAAKERGFQEGHKKGYEDAFTKLQADSAAHVQTLEKLVGEFENAKGEIFQANERFLMDLIFRIARSVLLKELSADREYLLRLSKELIERIAIRDSITIRVNSEDIQTLEMLKVGIEKRFEGLKNLKIEHSNQISAGGCQVETEWNAIDASIEAQLSGIYSALINENNGHGQKAGHTP